MKNRRPGLQPQILPKDKNGVEFFGLLRSKKHLPEKNDFLNSQNFEFNVILPNGGVQRGKPVTMDGVFFVIVEPVGMYGRPFNLL